MNPVTIAELENDLRGYLKKVRKGEELLIKVRNKPVAKIVALESENGKDHKKAKPSRKSVKPPRRLQISDEVMSEEEHEAYLQKLAAEGGLRLPEIEPDDEFWEKFWAEYETSDNAPPVSIEKLLEAVRWARDED